MVIFGFGALLSENFALAILFGIISIYALIKAVQPDFNRKLNEEPRVQPVAQKEQKNSNGSPNFQNERLNFLIDSFQTYMSKPFPNKYLNPNDPFFDDFYTTIARIKGYDFRCGYEKENQLLDKIRVHNEIISNSTKPNKTHVTIGLDSKTSKERLNSLIDTFESYMSKPFPDKFLNPNDSFFDDFYATIVRIKGYDLKCGYEKENQLLEKIRGHNEIISNSTKLNETRVTIGLDSKTSKERLNSLLDSFETYMSKPFPDKHLNTNDPFFDDFWRVIGKISVYDFECGLEKEKQFLEKIRSHNEIITNKSKPKKFSQSISQQEFTDKIINGLHEKIERQRMADLAIEDDEEDFIETYSKAPVFSDICGFSLNDEQRKAILCNSKYNLVLADAGSGKTLTILGKIKYLLENNLAKEDEILILSYLDESVDELNRRIPEISPNLKAKTFHSFGFDILSEHIGEKKAVDDQLLARIKTFFDKNYDKNRELRDNVDKYLSLSPRYPYFIRDLNDNSPESADKLIEDFRSTDFNVLNEALKKSQGSSKRLLTIKKESVKSMEELVIANYLFVNGIKYEYEKPYEINTATVDKRQYCPDFYLPRYKIYIEHYGTNQAGKTPQYSADEEQKYKESMEWKRMTHKQYKTTCIETYSSEFADGTIFDHLKEKLAKYEVKFKERWTQNYKEEVKNALMNLYDGRDLSKLMYILEDALSIYKSGCVYLRWKSRVDAQEQERIGSFLKILKEIKDYYDKALKRNKKVDFDDMILQATKYLPKFKDRYRYKYILIDEFHDTPPIIFNFLEQLVEHGNSKLMAVGDNRQYKDRFTSSDISIIWDLKEKSFPKAEINRISKKTLENSGE